MYELETPWTEQSKIDVSRSQYCLLGPSGTAIGPPKRAGSGLRSKGADLVTSAKRPGTAILVRLTNGQRGRIGLACNCASETSLMQVTVTWREDGTKLKPLDKRSCACQLVV